MPWYVIQTYTGREEQLVEMIRRIVPGDYYGECFVAYAEQLRHRQQENQVHVLRLFPGYVFISSGNIGQLFRCLKKVPAMSRIMAADDFTFTPLCDGEAEFLLGIMDGGHTVRLSYVATDGRDHVTYVSGPLRQCQAQVKFYRFRRRYAAVRLTLEGREKEIKLGIILNDDVRRELAYGKVEIPAGRVGKYTPPAVGENPGSMCRTEQGNAPEDGPGDLSWKTAGSAEGTERTERGTPGTDAEKADSRRHRPQYTPGDRVLVMEGAFEGSVAAVSQAGKDTLRISVQMFGRGIQVEVPVGNVAKIE